MLALGLHLGLQVRAVLALGSHLGLQVRAVLALGSNLGLQARGCASVRVTLRAAGEGLCWRLRYT